MVATYDRVSCRAVSYGACVGSTRSVIGALDGDRRQRPQTLSSGRGGGAEAWALPDGAALARSGAKSGTKCCCYFARLFANKPLADRRDRSYRLRGSVTRPHEPHTVNAALYRTY